MDSSLIAGIEAAGAALSPVWDLRYRGSAADPTLTNVATFTYDTGIESKWPYDGSNPNSKWPTIHSPLVGADIGVSPYAL